MSIKNTLRRHHVAGCCISAIAIIIVGFVYSHKTFSSSSSDGAESDTATALSVAQEIQSPFMQKYQNTENAILIDVRTPEEYRAGHIPEAINIDFYSPTFAEDINTAVAGKSAFIYCRSGSRSSYARQILAEKGIVVEELPGGVMSYHGELVTE